MNENAICLSNRYLKPTKDRDDQIEKNREKLLEKIRALINHMLSQKTIDKVPPELR